MKIKNLSFLIVVILGIASIAAFRLNVFFTSASPNSIKNVDVVLKGITYTDDHVMIEFSVSGDITTPDGPLTECPVGDIVLLDKSGKEFQVSNQDFVFCRPDEDNGYLVTQFLYGDYSGEDNKPIKAKIKIGDVNFTADNGNIVKVGVVGYKHIDFPAKKDADSVAYPSEIATAISGLKMKIKRVDFSPSMAKVDACITLPDTGDWVFDAYLLIGDQKVPFEYWTIPNYKKSGVLDSPERCYSVIVTDIPDYKAFRKGDVSFVIEKISRNMPDCVNEVNWNKIKDELAKYNIPFVTDTTGAYCFAGGIRDTDTDLNAYLNIYIKEALKEEVEGPLVINVK
jgi:hypothetical protein